MKKNIKKIRKNKVNVKKSDVEVLIVVLGSCLTGLVLYLTVSSLSQMLVLQKSSLLGIQFLEGLFLTHYFFAKESSHISFSKEKPFVYSIDTGIPITNIQIDNNGFKINNFCFYEKDLFKKNLFQTLNLHTTETDIAVVGLKLISSFLKKKNVVAKKLGVDKILNLYILYKWSIKKTPLTCYVHGKEVYDDKLGIIIKVQNTLLPSTNLVFRSYFSKNKKEIIEIGTI